jgi:serine/threonine-protein kinase HipA
MTDVRVSVRISGQDVHAGTLYHHRRRGTESTTFMYDGEYLDRPQAYALDPQLPLFSGSLHTRVVPTGLSLLMSTRAFPP